jgi:uncharacterized membrane protein YcaP (DUF421 family)
MAVDWSGIFGLSTSPLEILIRGTAMYLAIFFLLRVMPNREASGVNLSNILVIVLIADAAQNGMAGDYRSVTEGLLLVGTILIWSLGIDWVGHEFPSMRWILEKQPALLIRDGVLMRRQMRRELLSEEEVMSQLRQQGIDRLSDVRRACIEPDGHISVVKRAGTTQ